jgi:hypothetical protein
MLELPMGNIYAEWRTLLKGEPSIKKPLVEIKINNVVAWIDDQSNNAEWK